MTRILALFVVLFVSTACQGSAAPPPAEPPAQAAAPQPAPAQPVPAQLPEVLARVNGEPIERAALETAIRDVEAQAGGPVPAERRDEIYRGMLDQLIDLELLTQEIAARDVQIPESDVEARIAELKSQAASAEAFDQMLAAQQLTVADLKSQLLRNMRISKMLQEQVGPTVKVDPADVTAFYEQNPDEFKEPEQIRASHILVAAAENADEAARKTAQEKAAGILEQVKAGQDFAALAKEHSGDPGTAQAGGDLGFFQPGQMVGPFEAAAFQLQPGQVSDVVETPYGFHIIKVTERKPSRTVPLDEVGAQIERYLTERQRQEKTRAFIDMLKQKAKVEIFI